MWRETIATIATILLFAMRASAAVITVDDDGPADFQSIQAAIDAAAPGDIISIAEGIYRDQEPIVIQKEITIQGSKTGETRIEAVVGGGCVALGSGPSAAIAVV